MILNNQTAVALFVSAVATFLAAAIIVLGTWQLRRASSGIFTLQYRVGGWGRAVREPPVQLGGRFAPPQPPLQPEKCSKRPELFDDGAVERGAHLLDVMLATLGVALLAAWPQFFALLKSYVPELSESGAMCAFGIARVNPRLVLAVQLLLPTTLWLICLSRMLTAIDQRTASALLVRRRIAVAFLAATVGFAAATAELWYLFAEKAGRRVTCCTQFLATETIRPSSGFLDGGWLPLDSHVATLTAYFGVNLATIACALWITRRKPQQENVPLAGVTILAILAVAALWSTFIAWKASVAPLVLDLPHHRCVYELLTDTWAMGFAGWCAVAGSAGLAGLPVLAAIARPAGAARRDTIAAVGRVCAGLLASSLLIVGIHLA